MSILNVNTIQPIGSGTTVTVAATELKTSNFITVGTGASVTSPSANVLTLGTNNAERLRITSAGLIGIGTVSPSGSIHAHTASGTQRSYLEASASHSFLRLKSGSTSYNSGVEFFSGASNIANVNGLGAGGLQFEVNGSERLRIASDGKVGINESSPTRVLSINGDINLASGSKIESYSSGGNLQIQGGSTYPGGHIKMYGGSGDDMITFNTSGSSVSSLEKLRINSAGRMLLGTTTVPTGLVLGNSLTAASSTGAEVVAFRSDTSVAVGDVCGAFVIGNSDTDGAEDHFVGMWGKVASTNGSMNLHFAAGRASYEGDTPDVTIKSGGNIGIGTDNPQQPVHLYNVGSSNVLTTRIQQESSNTPTDGGALLELGGTRSDGTYGFYGGIKGGRRNQAADNKGYLSFFSDSNDGQSLAERMRLDDGGRLLVGTTSGDSNTRLHVSAAENTSDPMATDASIVIANTQNAGNNEAAALKFNVGNTNTASISAHYDSFSAGVNSSLRFYTQYQSAFNSPAERMRITNAGAIRIGSSLTANAAGRFQVVEERSSGDDNDCNAYFETNRQDWNIKTYYNRAGTHYHLVFMEQGTERGSIRGSDGSNVTFNQGSDYRWKENVVEMTGTEGIEICKRLKPSKYNWIENREQTGEINTVDGFIAHEVEEAGVLGAVVGEKDAVNEDGSIKGQLLDYGQMTPVLAAGIKGLIAKVETLEAQVAALQGS